MYLSKPVDEYFPQPPLQPGAPRLPSTGFPLVSTNQYYTPTGPGTFQVQSQPAPPAIEWSTGLCDCGDNLGNCCITCFCPCVTFGRIAEIVDRGSSSCGVSGALYMLIMCVTGCHCIYSCFYRSKMRAQYSIKQGSCPDCCIHCCCEVCALSQEYRELQNRGFNMSTGWHANMEKQALGEVIPVPPPVVEGMTR